MQYKCLSIAGFDGSGGAGIQADLKTFSALGCYGMTVLTALPVQNTQGVRNCYPLPISCIEEQLTCIFDDITPDCIKIGMLFSESVINTVTNFLINNKINIPIILDPVMIAKSGDALLLPEAIHALKQQLIPLCTIITPNIPEAETLVGSHESYDLMAEALLALGPKAVLLKGGHLESNTSDDLFIDNRGLKQWLSADRIKSNNTHGTGCTLSAAICAFMAKGYSQVEACQCAKEYLTGAIKASVEQSIGKGHGPVHHFYELWK